MWERSFLRLWNLSYVYENHVQRNAMTGIRSSMKMTRRCGSRMIFKAERRLEKHRRDYMGRVHRIYSPKRTPQNISISSCLFRSTLASILVLFLLVFLYPHIWRARRAQFTSTPLTDYLLLPFRKTIFNRRHSYSDLLFVKRNYRKRDAYLVKSIYYYYLVIKNRIIFQKRYAFTLHFAFTFIARSSSIHLLCFKYLEHICLINPWERLRIHMCYYWSARYG